MNRDYTLIGLYSFVLSFVLSLPVSGLLWLAFYNKKKFAADFLLFKVYSFQSMVILSFLLVFIISAAYFYFVGLPSLSSLFSRAKKNASPEKQEQAPPTTSSPPGQGA